MDIFFDSTANFTRMNAVEPGRQGVLKYCVSHNTITLYCFWQAVCEWGRDSIESWGRRRRSVSVVPNNNDTSENSEDMTQISQEILVLDFGDEKQSQFLKSNEPQYTEFNNKGNILV